MPSRRALLTGAFAWAATGSSANSAGLRAIARDIAAPPLRLPAMNGTLTALDTISPGPVIVAFWATWCAPCRVEMPALAELALQEGLAVLAVNAGESEARVVAFAAAHRLDGLTVLLDRDRRAMSEWRVGALPTAYVVSADRYIRYLAVGDIDWSASLVRDTIRALRSAPAHRQNIENGP